MRIVAASATAFSIPSLVILLLLGCFKGFTADSPPSSNSPPFTLNLATPGLDVPSFAVPPEGGKISLNLIHTHRTSCKVDLSLSSFVSENGDSVEVKLLLPPEPEGQAQPQRPGVNLLPGSSLQMVLVVPRLPKTDKFTGRLIVSQKGSPPQVWKFVLTRSRIVLSAGDILFLLLSDRRTSLLLLAVVAAVAWVTYRLYSNRISTLAGIVTVDGQLLPEFRIDVSQGAPQAWQLKQECTKGLYAIYNVPVGECTVKFTWGTADSCRLTAALDLKKGRNLFDVKVSLELDNLDVRRAITSDIASSTISWIFRKPITDPAPARAEEIAMKYIYSVSHVYTDKSKGTNADSGQETEWPSSTVSAATDPWRAETNIDSYSSSGAPENWSVEVYVDGFPAAKKATKITK